MTTPSPTGLRALFTGGSATGLTDGQLLERFQHRHESAEAAFEALVDRHAAMVWGVCRRSLDRADAEDAFQATFLVLVRRAGAIRPDDRGSVGRWLYGVARRVAGRLRQEAARRPPSLDPALAEDPASLAERRDVREAVAVELDRLPAKYRRPIELCDFEGLTYEQAGISLGWPTATLKNRLAQGRSRLRDRLTRRGLAPAAAVATAAMARECRAGVPRALVHSTCRAGAIASGTIPATVARLAEGVTQAMLWNKLKLAAAVLLSAVGVTLVAVAGPSSFEEPPRTASPDAKASNPVPEPDGRWTRKFPELEIVAISSLPSGPDTWWRPDGSPLKNPPFDPTYAANPERAPGFSSPDEANRRMFVYRVSDHSPGTFVDVEIHEASAMGHGPVVTQDGKLVAGLRAVRADFGAGSQRASLRFRIGSGPWETIQSLGEGRGSTASLAGGFVSSGAIPGKDGGTIVALAHNIDDGRLIRVVAVDAAGSEFLGTGGSASAGEVRQVTVKYPLAPDKIREFRVQIRLLDELTIPNIAIHPRKADEPR